jgi:hypothetical protein
LRAGCAYAALDTKAEGSAAEAFGEIGDVHIVSHGAEQIPSYVLGETVLVLAFYHREALVNHHVKQKCVESM